MSNIFKYLLFHFIVFHCFFLFHQSKWKENYEKNEIEKKNSSIGINMCQAGD